MVSLFYQKNIIEKPKLTLLLLFVFLVGFGFFSKDFKLDASSDTLLLENDPDLKYLREVTDRYGSKEFLKSTGPFTVETRTPLESIETLSET